MSIQQLTRTKAILVCNACRLTPHVLQFLADWNGWGGWVVNPPF